MGSLIALHFCAEPQPAQTLPRVGILLNGSPSDSMQSRELEVFTRTLVQLGWIDGENYRITARWVADPERLSSLATEMVRIGVEIILAPGAQATLAARAATSEIPIVTIAGTDPRVVGAASFAHPGGNVTGITIGGIDVAMSKRLQLLKEAIPEVGRVTVVWDVKAGRRGAGGWGLRARPGGPVTEGETPAPGHCQPLMTSTRHSKQRSNGTRAPSC